MMNFMRNMKVAIIDEKLKRPALACNEAIPFINVDRAIKVVVKVGHTKVSCWARRQMIRNHLTCKARNNATNVTTLMTH